MSNISAGRHDDEQVVEQEIKHEQSVVDCIYARLEAAAQSARSLAVDGHARARLGNESGLVERDAMVFQAAKRLASLDAAHDGLVFGRLDLVDDPEPRYIGRLGLRDADREILLVDWRAPAASVFYQATGQDPLGVIRRRVLQSQRDRVVGVQDDLLDAERAPGDLIVVGEGALMAALTRSRDRSMHSVVATIQKEQDDAIRAPHAGVTTIAGGPGTGKTVVALHRAAFLLYTDRRRYESGGVLVVGPNPVFMSYIERVLPSLGETTVSLRALGEVIDGMSAIRHDSPAAAAVKGSQRMTQVLARTVGGRVPGGPLSYRVFYRDDVLVLTEQQLTGVRTSLLGNGQRRNRAASEAADAVIDALWRQVTGERALERGKEAFAHTLTTSRDFKDFVRGWWPVLDAVEVLSWLGDIERLRSDAFGILSDDEIDDLVTSFADDASVADVALLDELRYLLGEPPEPEPEYDPLEDLYDDLVPELSTSDQRRRGGVGPLEHREHPTGSIEDDGYAHVLVDEAQDLSPMQWRMLGRRGRGATWTIVRDPAQSSWPRPEESEQARRQALADKAERTFRLSTNYRNSAEIFDLAARVARASIPEAELPVAVRRTGIDPRLHHVDAPRFARAVREALTELVGRVAGTVAVVVPAGRRAVVEQWLGERDRTRVPVLEALDTKGLEFDGILVVQPDDIVSESPAGMRLLYVVLTRATQELDVVGTTHDWLPLPSASETMQP